MTDYPKFDGECHVVPNSKEFGYIALKCYSCDDDHETLHKKIEIILIKYAEYLYSNDKSEVIDILIDIIRSNVFNQSTSEKCKIIYRPSWHGDPLNQEGTVMFKFKRAEKDNL